MQAAGTGAPWPIEEPGQGPSRQRHTGHPRGHPGRDRVSSDDHGPDPAQPARSPARRHRLRRTFLGARRLLRHRSRRAARHRPRQVRRRPDRDHPRRAVGPGRRRPEPLRADAPGARPRSRPTAAHVVLPLSTSESGAHGPRGRQPPRALGEVDVVFPCCTALLARTARCRASSSCPTCATSAPGVLASAAGMDKHYMKVVFAGHGLPIGPYTVITDRAVAHRQGGGHGRLRGPGATRSSSSPPGPGRRWGSPGSTTSPTSRRDRGRPRARPQGHRRGRASPGARSSAPCSRGDGTDPPRTSQVGEIAVHDNHAFYDFEAKYLSEADADLSCPADVPEDVVRRGAPASRPRPSRPSAARGSRGSTASTPTTARCVINEINTMPGFTPHSMYPRMWAASGCPTPSSSTS